MPEYLAPGVYVEEISTGPRPLEGVGTSTAGLFGRCERGPEAPKLITSWLDYQGWYGRHDENTGYLSYAVQGFFDNGGQRCFISRIAGGNAAAATRINAPVGLDVYAVGRGAWGNNIRYMVGRMSAAPADTRLKMIVLYYRDPAYLAANPFINPLIPNNVANPAYRSPDRMEVYENLSVDLNSAMFIETVVNASSRLVRIRYNGVGAAGATALVNAANLAVDPANRNAPAPWNLTALAGGTDVAAWALLDYQGSEDAPNTPNVAGRDSTPLLGRGRGLLGLNTVDEIAILLCPDENHTRASVFRTALIDSVITQCELLKDRFAIVSAPRGVTDVTSPSLNPPRDTSYAAYYYPWIQIFDPATNALTYIPPSGHMAGIYAQTDNERGVHKAPANVVVRGALNLELTVTKGMQDILNPRGVNCLRDFRSDGRSIRVWGARTMSSDGLWKYINVRRLFLYVEESIDEGMQWVVFEPNDDNTWSAVRRTITSFLSRVWRDGALLGLTAEEAFFVRCDRTTMTQDDIDNGRLICYIGMAPVKPAEFVIFRISQKTLVAEQA